MKVVDNMKQPLTVSALNKYLKYCYDNDINLQNIYLKGEISNFKHHNRGHFYFTLKDETSQVSSVMFSQNANLVKFNLEDGMKVIVEGYVTLYVQGGSYQIVVKKIIVDGLGELYLRFEQLKERLEKVGLFSVAHKKQLPKYPKRIAVITSNTGAAIRDILSTLERRYPLCEVIIFPTLVQGESAKDSIVDSITKANLISGIDLIILGRGGGSIEDLWCFNEEIVAYAIYKSEIPIISAVGHETDFTISDFVSDFRAATPTAAAEISVPNKDDLLYNLKQVKNNIQLNLVNSLNYYRSVLNKVKNSYVFINPSKLYEQNYFKLDKYSAIIEKNNPISQLKNCNQKLNSYKEKLNFLFNKIYQQKNSHFTNIINQLHLVNPLNILQKGYSIVKKDEDVISSIANINLCDSLVIYLQDGLLNCEVKNIEVKKYE